MGTVCEPNLAPAFERRALAFHLVKFCSLRVAFVGLVEREPLNGKPPSLGVPLFSHNHM